LPLPSCSELICSEPGTGRAHIVNVICAWVSVIVAIVPLPKIVPTPPGGELGLAHASLALQHSSAKAIDTAADDWQ
jgi:hypothetical protein